MENVINYKEPQSIEERRKACEKLIDLYDPKMTIVMDEMSNELDNAYKAHPERLYIILDGVIAYVGGNGPFDYNLEQVELWLKKNV